MSIFTKTVRSKLPSNVFKDLSYSNKLDMQIGYLYPVEVEEIYPGDIFFAGFGAMVRSQPLVNPVMHNFNLNVRYFFVPNRLVWQNFEAYITNQEKGKASVVVQNPHVHPYLAGKVPMNMLHDCMGISPLDGDVEFGQTVPDVYYSSGLPINALPFRAYNLIWNEYYKDENVMDDLPVVLTDGADQTPFELQRVSWKKDYFTSALPFAQRGEAVQMIGRVILGNTDNAQHYVNRDGDPLTILGNAVFTRNQDGSANMVSQSSPDSEMAYLDPNGTLNAAVEFSAIRRATALQRFLERSALGGNRYAELLLAHFGVRSSDASLQRPQYLGGGVAPINISPVEQTSGTLADGETPQGNLAGKGVGVGSMYMNKATLFTEHGFLIGLAYIRPDADYFNGIRRTMVKGSDRYEDYFWPDFQNIGEQEIHNFELFAANGAANQNNQPFGYQSRYAHLKWHGNEVHGAFRKELRSWVAPREFSSLPTLSKDFIECDLDVHNNFAVSPDVFPPFMLEGLNVVQARRPMYYFNRGVL